MAASLADRTTDPPFMNVSSGSWVRRRWSESVLVVCRSFCSYIRRVISRRQQFCWPFGDASWGMPRDRHDSCIQKSVALASVFFKFSSGKSLQRDRQTALVLHCAGSGWWIIGCDASIYWQWNQTTDHVFSPVRTLAVRRAMI